MIADRFALESAVERSAASLGSLDVAVLNAGAAAYGAFSATSADDFERTLAVTLGGAANTVRCVLPHLERSGGSLVVVVGSVADTIPLPLMTAYTAAKHGLRGFVDALAGTLHSLLNPVSLAARGLAAVERVAGARGRR